MALLAKERAPKTGLEIRRGGSLPSADSPFGCHSFKGAPRRVGLSA